MQKNAFQTKHDIIQRIIIFYRSLIMTTKQRAYLKSLAMTMEPILQIGKSSMTPEFTRAIDEALAARELIKVNVLKNCADDPKSLAEL